MTQAIERLTSRSSDDEGQWGGVLVDVASRAHYGASNLAEIEILTSRVNHEKKLKEKVLRRLRGFLIEDQGEMSLVAFVENDQTYKYKVPTSRLIQAGIKIENQPFEMDEVEISSGNGEIIVGTRFRVLVPAGDAKLASLEFSEEYWKDREEALKYFKDASD